MKSDILFLFVFMILSTVYCDSTKKAVCENPKINQAFDDWNFSVSARKSGCPNNEGMAYKSKYVKWGRIFGGNTLKGQILIDSVCRRVEFDCQDTLRQYEYSGGIILEKSANVESYWFVDKFSKTKNGLLPGMDKRDVIKIMGKPEYAESCIWTWGVEQGAYGPLLFFRNDKLFMIHYRTYSCGGD